MYNVYIDFSKMQLNESNMKMLAENLGLDYEKSENFNRLKLDFKDLFNALDYIRINIESGMPITLQKL